MRLPWRRRGVRPVAERVVPPVVVVASVDAVAAREGGRAALLEARRGGRDVWVVMARLRDVARSREEPPSPGPGGPESPNGRHE